MICYTGEVTPLVRRFHLSVTTEKDTGADWICAHYSVSNLPVSLETLVSSPTSLAPIEVQEQCLQEAVIRPVVHWWGVQTGIFLFGQKHGEYYLMHTILMASIKHSQLQKINIQYLISVFVYHSYHKGDKRLKIQCSERLETWGLHCGGNLGTTSCVCGRRGGLKIFQDGVSFFYYYYYLSLCTGEGN